MASSENEYYLRAILLLTEGGSYISKKVLYREVNKNGGDLDILLKTFERKLRNQLHQKQFQKLFPIHGKTDVQRWDFQMVILVVKTLFLKTVSQAEKDKFKVLLVIRNEIIANSSSASLDQEEYNELRDDLKDAIVILASGFTQDVKDTCSEYISKYESGPLDITSAIENMRMLQDNEAMFREVLAVIEGLKVNFYTHTDIHNVEAKLSEFEKRLMIHLNGLNPYAFEKKIKVGVDTKLKVCGPSEDWSSLMESTLNDIFNEAHRTAGNDFDKLKTTVGQLLEIIRVKAHFKGSELKCVRELGKAYDDEADSSEQNNISHRESVDEAEKSKGLQLALECTSLEELHHVWNLFQKGDATEYLNEIADALSDHFGVNMSLKAHLDIDGFKVAIGETVGHQVFEIQEDKQNLDALRGRHIFDVPQPDSDWKSPMKTRDSYSKDMSDETLVTFKIDEENCEDKQIIARRLGTSVRPSLTNGELPDQTFLNELCSEIGRRSKVVARVCDAICNHIKTLDENILHVWAAYTLEKKDKIIFVVLVKGNIRLEKKIKYSFITRIENEYSYEAKDIMCDQSRKDYSLPQNDLENIKESISKNAPELMKRHKYLSVISGSSVRSRDYGNDPTNALKLVPEACIVLYVSTKRYIPIDEEPFEKYYDGVAVDVREGEFVPFVYAEQRQDKLKLGCQIRSSPDRPPNQHMTRKGSLGCFIDHPEYRLCALTCAHVLLFPWKLAEVKGNKDGKLSWPHLKPHDVVYQPADSNDAIGQLVQVIYDEGGQGSCGMEIALFQIDQRHPDSGEFPTMRHTETGQDMTFNSGKSYGSTRIGKDEAIKFGPRTDRTVGKFETVGSSVKTIRHRWKDDEFRITLHNQLRVTKDSRNPSGLFADRGDSGSLVFIKETSGDLVCVGIIEGGTTYGEVIVTPIKPILQKLGVPEIKSFNTEIVLEKLDGLEDQLKTVLSKLNEMSRPSATSPKANPANNYCTLL